MWVITTLSYLITALCLVLLCFTARMMVQRIHTASKKHGLAFFRDRDSRRISQLLIIVMFIMGLGPMPPAPAGVCGADPSGDSIDCATSVSNNCEDPCPFEDCSNGIDDDLDGQIDCADLDCQGAGSCP